MNVTYHPSIPLPHPWEWYLDCDKYWAARKRFHGGRGTVSVHEGSWPCDDTLAITVRPRELHAGHAAPIAVFLAVARANEELKGARSRKSEKP